MKACKILILATIFFANDLGLCDEYEFEPNIFLDLRGNPASCVSPTELQENYCLSWGESLWQLAKKLGYRCYLEQRLVYDCSSEDGCEEHGILVGNVRPLEAAQNCRGLPFANILEDTAGNFVCMIKATDRLIQGSFILLLCDDYRREYSVDLILELHGKPVACINETHVSEYCLSPRLHGQQVKERSFSIYLESNKVYGCDENGVCQGQGKLRNIPQSLNGTKDCLGISLKHLEEQVLGTYHVIIEDPTHLLQANSTLQFCKDVTQSSSPINNGSLIAVIIGIVAALTAVAV